MADDRGKGKRPAGSSRASGGSERSEVRQEARSRLEKLAKSLGNDEIAQRIAKGNATRDEMLAFVAERLQVVRELQVRELGLTQRGAHFDWWRAAADAHKGKPEPEPTRWHGPAAAYEKAMQAMCRGDLRRGEALLQEAIRSEQQTTDALTDLVDTTEIERAEPLDPGLFAMLVGGTPACGASAEPVPIRQLLDAILHVEQTVPDMPNRRRGRDPWWTLDEDEEEEEPADGGG
ncbi:MAG: hypothetical protein R3F59_00800 [Myxococcota bacterium]